MGSVNILIADHNNACAFFLKSVLQPMGYGVSMAFNAPETRAKVETGLFDTVLCDMDTGKEENAGLLGDINDLLPGLPIVIIYQGTYTLVPGVDTFCSLEKPLRVKKVSEMMDRVKNTVTSLENRRTHTRRSVNLPAELVADGRTIFCRATNLSRGGMQVETLTRARVKRGLEALLNGRRHMEVLAKLFLGKNRVWEFKTNVAYVERFRFKQPEQVGLSFSDLTEGQETELESFLLAAS